MATVGKGPRPGWEVKSSGLWIQLCHWLHVWAWVWPFPKSCLCFSNSRTPIFASHRYALRENWKQAHTTNAHSCIIHNSPKMEPTQMSISWQIDKQNTVCPHNGILFSQKEEWSTDTCDNMDEVWIHHANWKKPGARGRTLYDSIYMKCPAEANS